MIVIVHLNGKPLEHFTNYQELFDHLMTIEKVKLIAKTPNMKHMNWSFTIYPPKRVSVLYAHSKDPSEVIKEAVKENLPLIEICIGDYKRPQYTILTPNIDIDYLKKKWCIDYCTYHSLLVREV